MVRFVRSGICAVVILGSCVGGALVAQANLLVNGGFESPTLGAGNVLTVGVGSEPAGFGWSALAGNVDVSDFPNPFIDFNVPEGAQGLDLHGTTSGTITQVVATASGKSYRLTFLYADNPIEAGVSAAAVDVADAAGGESLLSRTVEHSTSDNGTGAASDGSADFRRFRAVFTARGPSTRLKMTSTSPSLSASGGVLLDAVSIVEALAADFDDDNDVDVADLRVWSSAFHVNDLGDADGDATSAGADFLLWQRQHGSVLAQPAAQSTAAAGPEPASLAIAAAVAVGLVGRRRS